MVYIEFDLILIHFHIHVLNNEINETFSWFKSCKA